MQVPALPQLNVSRTPLDASAPARSGAVELPGWTPAELRIVRSARVDGLLRGGIDAFRGTRERGNGQPLTAVHQGLLGPALSRELHVPLMQVAADLREARLYVGGPGASIARNAVTIGRDVYVQGESELRNIVSWKFRRWLTHELAHVVQWRRFGGDSDLDRTRRYLGTYVQGFVVAPHLRVGALATGLASWIRERLPGSAVPPDRREPIGDHIHDSHWMEREAESVAQRIVAEQLPQP